MRAVTVLRAGDRHPHVAELRRRLAGLGLVSHGDADPELFDGSLAAAVREFQQRRGLFVDSVVGPDTAMALEAARWRLGDRILSLRPGHQLVGDDVADLQTRLAGLGFTLRKVDGIFGVETDRGVRAFQRSTGLTADGVVGPRTLDAFTGLRRAVTGGAPNALREREAVHRNGGSVAGRTIMLDPGHAGRADDDFDAASGWAMLDICRRVEGRLTAAGVTVVFSRADGAWPTGAERAELANAVGADLALSIYCDRSTTSAATGVAAYYYASDHYDARSTVGEELADVLCREVSARTGLVDCRSHGRAWAFLTRTAMPAVRLDLGYVTNLQDSQRLADPAFRDTVAEAVVVGIQRVYLGDRDTAITGMIDLSSLRAAV